MLVALRLARRLQVGVLLLWACCLGAAAASPWIGDSVAPQLAWLCGDQGSTQAKGLDCPICLPAGAPQPADFTPTLPDALPDVPSRGAIGMARKHERALRPPARAPPPRIPNQKVTS